jgi:hypothetical protein
VISACPRNLQLLEETGDAGFRLRGSYPFVHAEGKKKGDSPHSSVSEGSGPPVVCGNDPFYNARWGNVYKPRAYSCREWANRDET